MKRTMRIMMIAIYCILSCNILASAGNDKPISVNTLPIKAQILLTNYFGNQKVALATIESGVVNRSYDVVLLNGTKLEFNKKVSLQKLTASKE